MKFSEALIGTKLRFSITDAWTDDTIYIKDSEHSVRFFDELSWSACPIGSKTREFEIEVLWSPEIQKIEKQED